VCLISATATFADGDDKAAGSACAAMTNRNIDVMSVPTPDQLSKTRTDLRPWHPWVTYKI